MSRSYRKTVIIKKNDKRMKKYSNKKVRKRKNISNGKAYKKILSSYEISDFAFFYSYKLHSSIYGDSKEEFANWSRRYKYK